MEIKNEDKKILEIITLSLYRELFYKEQEKLSNKYWYSEFDCSKSYSQKRISEKRLKTCENDVKQNQNYLKYFISDFCFENSIDTSLMFELSPNGRVKPINPNRRLNEESIIDKNKELYWSIFAKWEVWYSNKLEKVKSFEKSIAEFNYAPINN